MTRLESVTERRICALLKKLLIIISIIINPTLLDDNMTAVLHILTVKKLAKVAKPIVNTRYRSLVVT